MADLLEETIPRAPMPVVSPNQSALKIPGRRDRPGSEGRRDALTIALVIVVPLVAILTIGMVGTSLLDSRLHAIGMGSRQASLAPVNAPADVNGGRVVHREPGSRDNRATGAAPSAVSPGNGSAALDAGGSGQSGAVGGADADGASPSLDDSPAAAATENPTNAYREPMPDAAAVTAAGRKARAAYRQGFHDAQTPLDKTALANTLLDDAENSAHEPPERYALFDLARSEAVRLGRRGAVRESRGPDGRPLPTRSAGARVRRTDEDVRAGAGRQFAAGADSGGSGDGRQAHAANRYDEAVALTQTAVDAGRKLEDPLLAEYLGRRMKALVASQARYTAARAALSRLREQPDDPTANVQVGDWYWLDKHDRAKAFAYLAKSADYDFRWAVVAARETPEDPATQLKLADAWWVQAHKQDAGLKRTAMLRETLDWYRKVDARAPGANAQVADRIAQLKAEIKTP